MVDNYRIQYAYFVDKQSPEYKAPWNEIYNMARVFTPEDKAIQTANSDTPYSFVGMDLWAEPLVLTVPTIDKDRYFSLQFIDWYTQNFAYAGSRTTGNDGGVFLVAGPDWKGETSPGITNVVRPETANGGLTIYIQKDSPGKDKEANWLPAPDGPFWTAMRLYWPKPEAFDCTWKSHPLTKVH